MKTLSRVPSVAKQVAKSLSKSKIAVTEGDQDRIFIVTGNEGSGKSTLAMQLAYFLDPTFSIKDIVFTAKDFEDILRTKDKFGAVIFDEAFNGLSSRAALSKENRKLIRLLQECRQRNLFVFIVIPSIFLLEKYVALFRSHCCFHTSVYKKDHKSRYYKVFNRKNKTQLYLKGAKTMSYTYPKINKLHRFYHTRGNDYVPGVSEEAYRQKKLDSFRDVEAKKPEDDKVMTQRDVITFVCNKKYKIPIVELEAIFKAYKVPLSSSAIVKRFNKLSEIYPEMP